ncbi:fimbrial protein [Segatella copri]|uniref:fimbrial protein n=1 Tax=Segatella copri TaxID=165179 RepID=UPI0022314117|nr:fimbrial protein [Segatella copri]MCW4126610.1 fimbrial protein [Segatella copri]MCW4136025.1 fimbrial protein [Segatella copri]
MKIRDFILSLVSWFILLVTVSCSDELGGERAPISSESNLHVLVPTVLSSRGTRTDDASGLPTYNATVDECQINDLTLYAFPVDGNGKLLKETLPAPLATMMVEPHVANYQLNIEPGTYHIYVVANMNKVLSGKTIQTEDELQKIVLDYRPTSTTGMPVCTNIPMIYEPKDAAGKLAETEIKAAGDKYTEVAANLKFTCVKVKLNLIFDPSNAEVATNFGGKPFSINSILAEKLSPFTHLYWGGKFETPTWADKDYKDGFSSNMYQASERPSVYYADWTDNRSASATNNNDDIKGTGTATPNPVNAADKWLFQQTYYLPERYISSESDRSYLTINGNVGGSAVNNYRINLGHKKDETSTVPVFPRGTFYEITGAIKTLGNMDLDCKVSVKPWEMENISADFNHTTLWVSKTEASVTSTTTDFINYESNATITPENIGCETKIDGKDLIIPELEILTKQIKFRINKDINYSAYSGVYTGTAKVWLKANNLKKYIDVHYDVTPYLDVTPKEFVIYYEAGKPTNTKVVTWDTNLGGVELEKTSSTIGTSTIEMQLDPSAAGNATGTFTVTATTDPVTTTVHEFKVKPKKPTAGVEFETIRVLVSPPVGDYRIYFRAINDRSKYNGSKNIDRFTAIMTEGGDNNWYDGWDNDGGKNTAKEDNHHIYMYTQIGETSAGTSTLTQKRWIYTKGDASKDEWPGEAMKADNTNKGWYYKDFKVDMEPVVKKETTENRFIKPGETLIMFNNNQDLNLGYTLHRCPHHREPGIPLFDYEDREGWIVYDPTSDPVYHIFDDMPEIEDLKITIYTEKKTMGWYKEYGIAGDSTSDLFKIHDENSDENVDHGNSWEREQKGKWWKTVITLKAIKGEHNKDIKIKLNDGEVLLLFNGNSFKGDTGYYENGKWYQGKPSDVTE